MINIIVAATNDMVIGKDNDLPWRISSDLKYFKQITTNQTIVMGRKCFDSIGRPLPNRRNIIITRDKTFRAEGCEIIHNIDDILSLDGDIFIIGGSEIYKQIFPFTDKVFFTQIFNSIDGDTYLEGFDINEWVMVKTSETQTENNYNFRFLEYERNEKRNTSRIH